jgi:hypothetical protein
VFRRFARGGALIRSSCKSIGFGARPSLCTPRAHADPLIALGTAPLDDQFFRASVLDQLGEERLQAAILADIAGESSHAMRLDADAPETLRRLRLHQKVATALFFESSGGQQRQQATVPEVRLAVGEPDLDIGYVETALEALQDACYYLGWEGNRYGFSIRPNLNKLLADRRANLDAPDVEEEARTAIRKVFASKQGVASPFELCPFPDDTSGISDLPALQLVYFDPTKGVGEEARAFVRLALDEKGANARIFKNALIFVLPEASGTLLESARRALAWKTLSDDAYSLELDDEGRRQLDEQQKRAERDLQEAVWRAYHRLAFLGAKWGGGRGRPWPPALERGGIDDGADSGSASAAGRVDRSARSEQGDPELAKGS